MVLIQIPIPILILLLLLLTLISYDSVEIYFWYIATHDDVWVKLARSIEKQEQQQDKGTKAVDESKSYS